jgi:hypothetical protein
MSDFVRVSLPNGHEATLSRAYVESVGLPILDVPATNSRGVPLPATRKGGRRLKPVTTVAKEAAKKAAARTSEPPASSDNPTHDGVAVEPEEASK